ncbi:MAG: response regulator, partial [Clostridium sp.]|nr:response regulator [Clostridium sp.]
DGGTYTFKVRAINGDGIVSTQDITFTINKEYGFFEKQSTKNLLLAVAALVAILIIVSIYSLTRRMRGQDREIEKLEKEHEVAVKSSTAKSDFLAHMSNEIKIPVNAIISLADTIQREQSEEVRREGLQAIATSGQEILGKVDETIELARLESGRVAAVNAPYSITTLVCDISDRMINLLDQKPVRFLVDLGEHIPDILVGDYEKIRRVLEILLDNAGKYTREGTITLFVDYYEIPEAKGKNRLIFNISDTGIGIQKERLEHIFEVYNIADSKKQAGYTGSGISLTIANQLTATMGGEIEVESTYGAGSTFTVTLPQEMADQNMVASTFAGEAGLRITREEAERMAAPDVAVLLVDDVEISRTVALGVLRQLEIEADVADSGMRALDLAMNRQYDIIFMDLAMPVMNGMDAMKELREMEGAKDVPIIAMTEDALNEDRDALEKAGFSDMIVKPLELTVLAEILAQNTPEKLGPKERKIPVYTENVQNLEGLQELEAYLDVSGVLEKIGGSVEVYNRILSTFYSQNQNAEEELKEKFSDNYRSFRSRIHNIRNGAQNVGAIELQNHIQRIDSAINIGNKGYVRDNLPMLLTLLGDVLKAIRVYLDQTTEQKTVAEQVDRQKEKKPEKRSQIDFAILDAMLEAAEQGDPEALKDGLAEISFDIYENEDTEFLQVLKETVEKQDMAGVTDLIGTYKELKK